MASMPKISGMKKRQAINKASQSMLLWIVAASVTVSILLVGAQFFYQQFTYQNKVLGAKREAASTLAQNLVNIEELKKNFAPIESGAIPNVDTGKILSALPAEFDTSGFGTSLEQVFAPQSGVTLSSVEIDSSAASDDSLISDSASSGGNRQDPTPQPITATVVASGGYQQISDFVANLERSIRPITINTLDVSGTSTNLRATIELTTYYQPTKEFVIIEEGLPR